MTTISENLPTPSNPMGMHGIEFIEFATSAPLMLGALLAQLGFVATARHRSREVMLYQYLNSATPLNIIVNAAPSTTGQAAPATPSLSAIALRVRNAAQAHAAACALGAWDIPTRASAMELNIPGIHGVGDSVIYFVDRFSGNAVNGISDMNGATTVAGRAGNSPAATYTIYDVDFVPLPHEQALIQATPEPARGSRMDFFGIVQAVHADRSDDWIGFYQHLFGFTVKADDRHRPIATGGKLDGNVDGNVVGNANSNVNSNVDGNFDGVLRKGVVLTSPCKQFHLQLIEPPQGADDIVWDEGLIRIAFGAADVLALTQALQARGLAFVDVGAVKPSAQGALSHTYLGGVMFELVQLADPRTAKRAADHPSSTLQNHAGA
jgi:4-hydroxyphenylpyruvate dioxygenase